MMKKRRVPATWVRENASFLLAISIISLFGISILSVGLVTAGVALAAGSSPGEWVGQSSHETQPAQAEINPDSIVMKATLTPDGDADWRVLYRLQLSDEDEIQAFEELRQDIENDPSAYLDPFEDRIRRTVESARGTTGREMFVENFEIHAERTTQPDGEFGEVTFEFEWSGFAVVENEDTLRAGDALDSLILDEDTSLQIGWPSAYRLQSHAPDASVVEDGRIVWRGPLDFDSGEPEVHLTSDDQQAAEPTPTDADSSEPTPNDDEASLPTLWLVAGVLFATVGVGAWLVVRERRAGPLSPAENEADSSDGDGDDSLPSELLSNEERVLRLLDQKGGRMKQKEVADRLDWTAAKTSQVVSDLRDDGKVEAFRLGRENVLTLPDVDLEDNET